jgi:hypothetical protein
VTTHDSFYYVFAVDHVPLPRVSRVAAVILFSALAFMDIRRACMDTELPIADKSECRVLTQLGDTVTTKLLFLNGARVQEAITIEGPAELIRIRDLSRSIGAR